MRNWQDKGGIVDPAWLIPILALIFVLLFAAGAGKPLHLDNVEFPAVAAQTSVSGIPVYYHGEEEPHFLGLFHPPLYIYSLALWIRLFGFGEAQVRLFGMVCVFLQGLATLAILASLFGREQVSRWRPWFWLIFLLNPYTIQGASIADIDTTIYGPLMCSVVLAVIRLSWRDGVRRTDPIRKWEYTATVILVALCFWTKLTTVWILFPFVFLLLMPRLSLPRAAAAAAALMIAGLAVFLGTYFLYGKLTGLDVTYTFAFTWMSFVERGSSHVPGLAARLADFRRNASYMIPFMVKWTGLLPWTAGAGALIWALLRGWRERDLRAAHYGFILLLALLTTFIYCGKTSTFGAAPFKYVFVFWGLAITAPVTIAFSDAKFAALRFPGHGWWSYRMLMAIPLAAAAWFGPALLGDRVLTGWAGNYGWWLLLPAVAFAIGTMMSSRLLGRALLIAAFSVYCAVELSVALAQSKADYSTTYDYGQTGFMETVYFIKENTGPNDVIASMKDIGFRAGRRWRENYAPLYQGDDKIPPFLSAITSGKIAYIVFTEGRGQDQLVIKPSLGKWISAHCDLVRSFGNYRIYKYRPGPE